MNELNIDLCFSSKQIMKDLDALDIEGAQALYEMHTEFDSPLLQTEEEGKVKYLKLTTLK